MSKQQDKTAAKRNLLIHRTSEALQINFDEAAKLLRTKHTQSIRLNPLKAAPADTLIDLKNSGWVGDPYNWTPNGFTITSSFEVLRDSLPVHNGWAFIQNAASWLPVIALDPKPDEQILDVCAAPGGKTSHIAAITKNQARIWATITRATDSPNYRRICIASTRTL